jgi:hypothetical protein
MQRTVIFFVIALIAFAPLSFLNIPYSDRLAEIFFGICGVLFSVGMSQIVAFDLSRIADKDKYIKMADGLKDVRVSFIAQFGFSSGAFIAFQILNSVMSNNLVKNIKGKSFSIGLFLTLVIIYSLFFFLYNFHLVADKKAALDKIIRDEAMDEQE